MKKITSLIFVFMFIISVLSYENNVFFRIDTKEVFIGTPVHLKAVLKKPMKYGLKNNFKFDSFEVYSVDTSENSINITLTPIEEGNLIIKPKKFELITDKGIFSFKNPTFEVKSKNLITSLNGMKPKTFKSFWKISPSYDKKKIAIFVLALLLFTGLIYFIFRKRKEKIEEKIYEPPHVIAYRELEELLKKNFIKEKKQKEFCLILSNILKKYINDNFKIDVLDKTTYDMKRILKKNFPYREELLKNFEIMDLIKFAKYETDDETLENMAKFAKKFIDETKPKIEVVNEKRGDLK